MEIGFNIAVILLILLITYWWANQGFLSSLLHLLAVVLAGAVAIGFWELVANLMIRGGGFDQYAWGTALIGMFAICLVVFRIASDRLVPNNVGIPRVADLVGGGICGLGSGTITTGILLLGCGFIYSHSEIMGYRGYGRAERTGEVQSARLNALWVPAEEFTAKFYSLLSGGALYPDFSRTPLYQYSPDLHKQAYLVRDTFSDGKGALAMPKDAADVKNLYWQPDDSTVGVMVEFNERASDFADQLALSSSQVRLIGWAKGRSTAPVVHPSGWMQDIKGSRANPLPFDEFTFDSSTNYATSITGRNESLIMFKFRVPSGFQPRFIQIRNARYDMPEAEELPPAGLIGRFASTSLSRNSELDPRVAEALESIISMPEGEEKDRALREYVAGIKAATAVDIVFGGSIDQAVEVTNSTRPVRINLNDLSSMDENDRQLTKGFGVFPKRHNGRISKQLLIDTFYEPPDTRMVMVDISQRSVANLFIDRLYQNEAISEKAHVHLIDTDGNEYFPVGYFYEKPDKNEIKLEPGKKLGRRADFPRVPTRGDFKLRLMFYIPTETNLVRFDWDDVTVGKMQVYVGPQE
ncbi:MAG: hypothetical protein AAF432_01730 [Planctomycetota bacterium]